MALYNFHARFAPFVESGAKTHTIRASRSRKTKVGETLHLYTGLRQKGARKLLTAVCTKVEEIEMTYGGGFSPRIVVYVDGVMLSGDERQQLAQRDGFANWNEMRTFWEGRFPFTGQIIHWRKAGQA